MAAIETLSRWQERPHSGGKSDTTAAAGATLPLRQERLYHCGKRDSITITAASDTLSRRHDRLYHCGTRHSITVARDTLSRRHEAFYFGDKTVGEDYALGGDFAQSMNQGNQKNDCGLHITIWGRRDAAG